MSYVLPVANLAHLSSHFGPKKQSGSYFNADQFESPQDIIAYINQNKPQAVFLQSNGREAHLFELAENKIVGYQGLANINALGNTKIETEWRNGFKVRSARVKSLLPSSSFCVIIEKNNAENVVITMFPGIYAPPFPYSEQSEVDYNNCKLFWNNYVLLKVDVN